MHRKITYLLLLVSLQVSPMLYAADVQDAEIKRRAVSESASERSRLVLELRNMGSAGLELLLKVRGEVVPDINGGSTPEQSRFQQVLNNVCGQYQCQTSKLFWYTDLEQAKRVAEREQKPILSLRLLGKLTEEYSCANSRFFRAALYANQEVSQLLRDQFILHWKTEREIPIINIDFGDGRKLKRTITGNSAHYVLDTQGRVVDVLPGLYGPQAFYSKLVELDRLARKLGEAADTDFISLLQAFHRGKLASLEENWRGDIEQARIVSNAVPNRFVSLVAVPPAAVAMRQTAAKTDAERPLLKLMDPSSFEALKRESEAVSWEKIAQLHQNEAKLDSASVEFISAENPTAIEAGSVALSKMAVESPLLRLIAQFERSVAVDTVKNEYLLHSQIHRWLSEAREIIELETLNDRVYSELFLTPKSDPWLGLLSDNHYTALRDRGVTTP